MSVGSSQHSTRNLRVVVIGAVAALASLALSAPVDATASPTSSGCATTSSVPSRFGHIGGIFRPQGHSAGCAAAPKEAAYAGSPPLLNHGGPVMATPTTGSQVTITPIYWAPTGYSFTAAYKNVINTYLANVAADSGKTTNVYASNTQYSGSNGSISYHIVAGAAINVSTAYPAAGCTINGGAVYADGSGYSTCLDDAQLQSEVASVIAAHGFATDTGHLYALFTPKHVESCFLAGNPSNQACSINSSPSAAFCAYHGFFGPAASPSVYANMPFPIYHSATGYSCTEESLGGGIQRPNGNVDADVEISPLSHETSEAITDPELNAWYDASGFENGDDCAYIYGSLSGTAGAFYNQKINGGHYLTQEEFSNADFVPNVSGCVQEYPTATGPNVTKVTPKTGPAAGGTTVVIAGSGFTGATTVKFGATAASSFTVVSDVRIRAVTPAHAAQKVNVRVTTLLGTSPVVPADRYTYS